MACLPQELPVSTYGEQPARALPTRASESCRRPCPALSDPVVGGVPLAALEQVCALCGLDWLGSQAREAIPGGSSRVGMARCFGVREAGVSSRIRSDVGLLGERVRRRPTHCVVEEVHPGIVSSWSTSSSGWVALVAYGDESGVLHVGPLPAARLRPA